jgi:hypothetical protein
LLGTEPGDASFGALVEWIHGARVEAVARKIPVGGRPGLWGVSVSDDAARVLAPFVLMGLHGKSSAARLNTLLVRKTIEQAKIELSAATLVMVPFERAGEEVRAAGSAAHVPLLLLRGGPELEAQRATVHASHGEALGV